MTGRQYLWPVLPAEGRLVCRVCHHRAWVHRLTMFGRSLSAKCERCPGLVCGSKRVPADVEEG